MVLSLIFLGVEMRGQIFTFGDYGFVSDVFMSRDGSSAYNSGGDGYVSDIFRSRDERSDFHYW